MRAIADLPKETLDNPSDSLARASLPSATGAFTRSGPHLHEVTRN
jgi:hypothetical protein